MAETLLDHYLITYGSANVECTGDRAGPAVSLDPDRDRWHSSASYDYPHRPVIVAPRRLVTLVIFGMSLIVVIGVGLTALF